MTFSPRAMDRVRSRQRTPSTWYLDLSLLFQYWGEDGGSRERAFHHTAPVSSIYGFREALRVILEEGLEHRWRRHRQAHEYFVAGLQRLGLTLFTPPAHQLPMLHVINIPAGVDDRKGRRALLDRGIEIAGGFGPLMGKTWRVGLMGHNARVETVDRLLAALGEVLRQQGVK